MDDATLTLIDLLGTVALLLWGVHMVQSGIQRAFDPNLNPVLESPTAATGPASRWRSAIC